MRTLLLLLSLSLIGCQGHKRLTEGAAQPEAPQEAKQVVYVDCTNEGDIPMNFPESKIQYECK